MTWTKCKIWHVTPFICFHSMSPSGWHMKKLERYREGVFCFAQSLYHMASLPDMGYLSLFGHPHGPCTRMTHFPRVVDLWISIFIYASLKFYCPDFVYAPCLKPHTLYKLWEYFILLMMHRHNPTTKRKKQGPSHHRWHLVHKMDFQLHTGNTKI
jgi:hypothetical protein